MKNNGFLKKDFFVDPDIRKAEGLPPRAFTDPTFLELELEKVFRRSWLPVPADAYAQFIEVAGAQVPFSLLGNPLFLQCDSVLKPHAYPNVCTHASYPLVGKTGVVERIVCGQHGRAFTLEGAVRDPKFASSKKFPRPCDHLRDLPLEMWAQFFFVALDDPTARFEECFSLMRDSVAGLPVAVMRRARQAVEEREVEGNWKQHAWNYLDSMHIPLIHRSPDGLVDALHFSSYRTECYPNSVLQWAHAKDPAIGFAPEDLPARFRDPDDPERRVLALWWFVFPNMAFSFYPWGLSLNFYMPVPGRPDKTHFYWHHFVADERLYALREELWHMEKVDREDTEAIEATSRGLRSVFATRGIFSPAREAGAHWFHRHLYSAVFE